MRVITLNPHHDTGKTSKCLWLERVSQHNQRHIRQWWRRHSPLLPPLLQDHLVHDRPNEDPAVPVPDDAGSSYNSVNYAQSAIAQELLMIQFVLCYLKSLGSNQSLSLKDLTYKALFMNICTCTCATTSRMNSLANLGCENFSFKVGFIFWWPTLTNISSLQDNRWLEKQSRPGHIRGYLRVQRFLKIQNCVLPRRSLNILPM